MFDINKFLDDREKRVELQNSLLEKFKAPLLTVRAVMTYNKILRAQLLAIDDIMLFPVKREEATAFFNLVNTLHEKTSIIITTNKAPTEWVETLNDEILASALLDRLLYRCEVIKFTGSSYRLENRQTIFKTTTGTRNELMKP